MVYLPWNRGSDTQSGQKQPSDHLDAAVVCEFQDGTLAVYEDHVIIERVKRSSFQDRTIPADEITGVDYDGGITIGYIQIEQTGVPVESGGLLSDPVNPNTLHFDRSGRELHRRPAMFHRTRTRGQPLSGRLDSSRRRHQIAAAGACHHW
jgi:hypothetical protein